MLKENQSKPKIQVPASCVASGRGVRPCPQPPHTAWAAPGGTARGAESSAGQDEAPGGGEAGACSRELAWLVGKPRLVATGTKSLVSMATAWFGWLLQMPSRSRAVQAPTEHRHSAATSGQSSPCPVPAPSLPCCPRPHSQEQVQPGTDLPPSLMNFPGSLCSAEGSGLTYPEAREPEDIVQSSGALRRRLTHRLRLQHDTAKGGSTRCVSL